MSAAIEARSLSTLTALASNPPPYPRNPTHGSHEPLVLYIARVPGSRDVFLTPMKPREKVVTAEDIQSSLYFVHFDQAEDIRLIETPEPALANTLSTSPNRNSLPPVPRKAIPDDAKVSPGVLSAPKRKPVPGTLAPITDFENRQNISAAGYAQKPRDYPNPNSTRISAEQPRYSHDEEERPPLPPRRPSEMPYTSGTTLTLIRRDPASNAQWNVARIEDPPTQEISSSSLNESSNKRKTGSPMYIEITNPGYSKFLHGPDGVPPQSLVKRDTGLSVSSQNFGDRLPSSFSQGAMAKEGPREGNTFRRRLWMEGTKYANGNFGHRKINSHDSGIGRQDPRSSFENSRNERISMDHHRPVETPQYLMQDAGGLNTIQVSDKQSSFRGYVFMSPWNGRCEFVTGAGGGSLKCRHLVPGLQGVPPVSMPVSELRFNLPSTSKFSASKGEDGTKRSSLFHRPRGSRNNSSVSDVHIDNVRSSMDRLDLSLGQEYAGGGFGGKQAKLGKLIIEDEGLKMMDLLVAANVALWWRAYERATGAV